MAGSSLGKMSLASNDVAQEDIGDRKRDLRSMGKESISSKIRYVLNLFSGQSFQQPPSWRTLP